MASHVVAVFLLMAVAPSLARRWVGHGHGHHHSLLRPGFLALSPHRVQGLLLGPKLPKFHLPPGLLHHLRSPDDWQHAASMRPIHAAFRRWEAARERRLGQCGVPRVNPRQSHLRILGGKDAWPGSWPWMASLYVDGGRQVWCAGSLIDEQWVVTAAHCFFGKLNDLGRWTVRLGTHNASLQKTQPEGAEQSFGIARLYKHALFDTGARLAHDLALLKLDRPARLTDRVWPLCLPGPGDDVTSGEMCKITGWGIAQVLPYPMLPVVLQEAAVPVWRREACLTKSLYPKEMLAENTICAGPVEGGTDSCNSDSGGPLQCVREDKWTLQGITSWGGQSSGPYAELFNCGQPRQPGVYTHVTRYRDWLLWHIFLDQYF